MLERILLPPAPPSMKLESTLIACLFLCVACGDNPTAPATPGNVTGSWGENPLVVGVQGYTFIITLADTVDVITGRGQYQTSAGGAFGSLAVSGTARGDSVHLRVIYNPADLLLLPPDTARLDGVFATRDRINAVRVRGGTVQSITLVRLQAGAPIP